MKQCSKCAQILTLDHFNKRRERPCGYRAYCKKCQQAMKSKWHQQNKQKTYRQLKQWRSANPDKLKKQLAIYRAVKKQNTPKWLSELDLFVMEEIYDLCRLKSQYLGQKYHVDHIVPLNGKTVSGLNVPWNLRIIPAVENMQKNNKWVV